MEVHLINSSPYDANAYLIVAHRPVLIDVGMNASHLLDRISAIIEPTDIGTIILTHGHYDHWGAVEEVSSATGADILIHARDAPMLADKMASAAAMFRGKAASFIPERMLHENDTIDLGNGSGLEVIHTPGHTPGCICLYHAPTRSLFSGDTVFQGGGFGRTDLAGGDQRLLVESLERLAEMDVNVLYPGHGEVTAVDASGQIRLSLQLARTYMR
ncbi:MAG: MBL fold metallo-hydrolase [Methanosarcinales archaeon]|nr:MBL fold metallo-hydrolase [ANME-2 cluster archaeon]MDF1531261.1 MBL fold metallo-hydrolase [ANME-2 cluster archaeon]MDW7776119.1 MBL fold metallo-hydrolase [Methanosarcinales archaeon]